MGRAQGGSGPNPGADDTDLLLRDLGWGGRNELLELLLPQNWQVRVVQWRI